MEESQNGTILVAAPCAGLIANNLCKQLIGAQRALDDC